MKSSRKMLVSVIALIIALAMATTATYAWFTMSANPAVEGLELTVTTNDGLLIAVKKDGDIVGNYKGSVTAEEIFAQYTTLELVDTTTEDGYDFEGSQSGNNNVFSFTLSFRSVDKMTIGLRGGQEDGKSYNRVERVSAGSLDKATVWDEDLDFSDFSNEATEEDKRELDSEIEANAANAVRLSFVTTVTTGEGEEEETVSTAKVWDPNYDKGFSNNETNLAWTYWNHINKDTSHELGAVPKIISGADGTTKLAKTLDELLTGTDKLEIDMTEDGDYYYADITINIWIEGWDGDAFRSVLGDTLAFYLQFSGIAVI